MQVQYTKIQNELKTKQKTESLQVVKALETIWKPGEVVFNALNTAQEAS